MKSLNGLSIALILLGGFLVAFAVSLLNQKPKTNLFVLMSKYRSMRKLLEAQARHETNNYTSNVLKRANNLFGMKNATGSRKNTQLGFQVSNDPYRHYKNRSESIRDMLDWLNNQNFPIITDSASYASALKNRSYYGDTIQNYLEGLNRWKV